MAIDKNFYVRCISKEVYTSPSIIPNIFRRISAAKKAVLYLRKMQYYYSKKTTRRISKYYQNKLIKEFGIFVYPNVNIGVGLSFPHPNGIIIGETVNLGENCTIYQQVTLGSARIGDYKYGKQPQCGDNVVLFAGAKIIGNINLSNGTVVGANAVLNIDTDENSTYVGIPAKKIRT